VGPFLFRGVNGVQKESSFPIFLSLSHELLLILIGTIIHYQIKIRKISSSASLTISPLWVGSTMEFILLSWPKSIAFAGFFDDDDDDDEKHLKKYHSTSCFRQNSWLAVQIVIIKKMGVKYAFTNL